jgi:gelsolin
MAAKLEDSNMAAYGGQDHKDSKLKKAQGEKEYKGAGKAEGIEIWRIENFGVKRIKKNLYGKFFSGDSYIVLNSYRKSSDSKKLDYNVHFWLGEFSTQDEKGTAAFKTVELDDLLGDLPVQYREVMGHESKAFMDLFNGKISIMEGGIAGAFNTVSPTTYTPRLMHFKGRKNIRVTEVSLQLSSLNQGDVFLLDNGLELIQWNGPLSGARERRAAMNYILALKENRNGRPSHRVLDGMEEDDSFWSKLGGMGEVPEAIPDERKKRSRPPPRIYSVSDAGGSMEVKKIAQGKDNMDRQLLDEDDAFIVDIGSIVYVWVGSNANAAERRNAMKFAADFLQSEGRPAHTPISRVCSGRENSNFNQVFGIRS